MKRTAHRSSESPGVAPRVPIAWFTYCPRCGCQLPPAEARSAVHCGACGFLYYFNPATAVGVFLVDGEGQVLFLRRTKEPSRGKLGVPGGFVDPDETVEAALQRELREEIGLEVAAWDFLCSQPNRYVYEGVEYPVTDLFFVAPATAPATITAPDEVADLVWQRPEQVNPAELAFVSTRRAWEVFRRRPLD